VFADLGVEHPEEYLAKSELAGAFCGSFQRRRMTQTAAGQVLGISQPKVSALLNGRLDGVFPPNGCFASSNNLGLNGVHPTSPGARPTGHAPGNSSWRIMAAAQPGRLCHCIMGRIRTKFATPGAASAQP